MKKITDNPILISVIIASTLFAIGAVISVFLVRNRLDNKFNGLKYELLLRSYESDIAVKNNNFNIFIVTLKNPNLENQENISFQLFEDGQVVRELQFSGANVGDPSDVRLQFAPIPDSKGKNYKVKLSITESNKPVSVYVGDNGQLAYRTYYRSTNKPLALKNFTTSFISRLFSDMVFVSIWVTFILSSILINNRLESFTKR